MVSLESPAGLVRPSALLPSVAAVLDSLVSDIGSFDVNGIGVFISGVSGLKP